MRSPVKSLLSSLNFTPGPTVTLNISIAGQRFKALIDSGANQNFICNHIAYKLNLSGTPVAENIRLGTNSLALITRAHLAVPITAFSQTYHIDFYELPQAPFDIILGTPALQLLQVIIDVSTLQITQRPRSIAATPTTNPTVLITTIDSSIEPTIDPDPNDRQTLCLASSTEFSTALMI